MIINSLSTERKKRERKKPLKNNRSAARTKKDSFKEQNKYNDKRFLQSCTSLIVNTNESAKEKCI